MTSEELKASRLILDLGVAIPIRPLRFFNIKKTAGQKTVVIRRPYMGGLIRMCEQVGRIGVKHEDMQKFTINETVQFMAAHGKAVSMVVAGAIVRGYFSYKLFARIVAWWLRWRVHPIFLAEAMLQITENIDIRPFSNTIKLVETMNLLNPRMSQEKRNGS
jgi:hypothetical protein